MTETTTDVPLWEDKNIEIHTKGGRETVKGLVNELCPGLAVTMNVFGIFDITHVASGLTVTKGYERMWNAALGIVQLSFCADWTKDVKDILAALTDEPCGISVDHCSITSQGVTRPMTKKEMVDSIRRQQMMDEFPWEGEDAPTYAAQELLEELVAIRSTTRSGLHHKSEEK